MSPEYGLFTLAPCLEGWAQLGHGTSPSSQDLATWCLQQDCPTSTWQLKASKWQKWKLPGLLKAQSQSHFCHILFVEVTHSVGSGPVWEEIHRAWVLEGGIQRLATIVVMFSFFSTKTSISPYFFSVPCVSGGLPKPTNITFLSINMKNILQWSPPEGLPGMDVTYTVQYFM